MRARSRVLLAALLALSVLVWSPGSAQAATASGWGSAQIQFDAQSIFGVTYRPEVNCGVSARIASNGRVEVDNPWCVAALDVTPGWTQMGEPGSDMTISVDGPGCGSSYKTEISAGPDDAWNNVDGRGSSGSFLAGTSCEPTAICIRLDGFGGGYAFKCQTVDFGTPSTPTCPYGTPTRAATSLAPLAPPNETLASGRYSVVWRDYVATGGSLQSGWGAYAVWQHRTTGVYSQYTYRDVPTQGGFIAAGESWQSTTINFPAAYNPNTGSQRLVGIRVFHWPTAAKVNMVNANGKLGVTDSAGCVFYMGEAIPDPGGLTGSQTAQPWGPTGADITPPSDTPNNPPPTNVPTDGPDGGLGQILGILATIAAAIGSIATLLGSLIGTLLAALVQMFLDLIVPDPGVIQGHLNGVRESWGDSTPGQWVDSLGAVGSFTPPGGGCAGPTLSVPIADVDWSAKPLDACSGSGATMASWSTMAITATVAVAGGMACIRILGSAFGWKPGMAGDDK